MRRSPTPIIEQDLAGEPLLVDHQIATRSIEAPAARAACRSGLVIAAAGALGRELSKRTRERAPIASAMRAAVTLGSARPPGASVAICSWSPRGIPTSSRDSGP
jgi:hypothetical protein